MKTSQASKPLDREEAARYLGLYLGEPSIKTWPEHIDDLYKRIAKYRGPEQAKAVVRKNISFALMLRYKEKTKIPEPVQNVLFGAEKWTQYDSADWESMLQTVLQEDNEIKNWRNQCLSLGVIHPIEYCPITRQAFNWLFSEAKDSGIITDSNRSEIAERFKKLVLAYGGNIICQIFMQKKSQIDKEVISWKTNYFFERLIFQAYTTDQLVKIKKQELSKANPKLVKQIRQD